MYNIPGSFLSKNYSVLNDKVNRAKNKYASNNSFNSYSYNNYSINNCDIIKQNKEDFLNINNKKRKMKFILNNKGTFKKYIECSRCFVVRPKYTFHCTSCNNCVVGYDHHSSTVGNCIGIRNFIFYYYLNAFTSFWIIIILTEAVTVIILSVMINYDFIQLEYKRNPDKDTSYLIRKNNINLLAIYVITVIIFIIVFLTSVNVFKSFIFNCYLVYKNISTKRYIDKIKYKLSKNKNKNNYNVSINEAINEFIEKKNYLNVDKSLNLRCNKYYYNNRTLDLNNINNMSYYYISKQEYCIEKNRLYCYYDNNLPDEKELYNNNYYYFVENSYYNRYKNLIKNNKNYRILNINIFKIKTSIKYYEPLNNFYTEKYKLLIFNEYKNNLKNRFIYSSKSKQFHSSALNIIVNDFNSDINGSFENNTINVGDIGKIDINTDNILLGIDNNNLSWEIKEKEISLGINNNVLNSSFIKQINSINSITHNKNINMLDNIKNSIDNNRSVAFNSELNLDTILNKSININKCNSNESIKILEQFSPVYNSRQNIDNLSLLSNITENNKISQINV